MSDISLSSLLIVLAKSSCVRQAVGEHLTETSGGFRRCRERRDENKQGGHRECCRHLANCIQVEGRQRRALPPPPPPPQTAPDGRDEITRKIKGTAALTLYNHTHAGCTDAPLHLHTLTVTQQPPDPNKLEKSTTGRRQVCKMHPTC